MADMEKIIFFEKMDKLRFTRQDSEKIWRARLLGDVDRAALVSAVVSRTEIDEKGRVTFDGKPHDRKILQARLMGALNEITHSKPIIPKKPFSKSLNKRELKRFQKSINPVLKKLPQHPR